MLLRRHVDTRWSVSFVGASASADESQAPTTSFNTLKSMMW